MQSGQSQPVFNAPGVVVGLALVLIAVHVGRNLVSPEMDNELLNLLAFNSGRFTGGEGIAPVPGWVLPVSFLSHALLHGDVMHLAINTAWLLAVGTPVARRTSVSGFLALFALCAAGGALLFMAWHPGLNAALVGASGGISGLMGAVFRLMFAADDPHSRYLLREYPLDAPRLTVGSMLRRPAPRTAILVWVGINIAVAVAMGSAGEGMPIAWEAHLGGFIVGLLVLDLFDKGWPEETPRDA
jgi:membrane associated rhomboid family serine protease